LRVPSIRLRCPSVSLGAGISVLSGISPRILAKVPGSVIRYLAKPVLQACLSLCFAVCWSPTAHGQSVSDSPLNNANAQGSDCVILLHGLARTARSMKKLQTRLQDAGYRTANIDYPSRLYEIPALAKLAINAGLDECRQSGQGRINFVTHSLGGILVRQYLLNESLPELRRVVMLGPPNQGSEVVDSLRNMPGFAQLNGPAGLQLGTGADDVPRTLGAVDFDLGVIAGTRTINLILSLYLPNPDDGKVSVASAKVDGMCDFITLPVSHALIMRDEAVMDQVQYYLSAGRFSHREDSENTTTELRSRAEHCTGN